MSETYAKLFSSILRSSIWAEPLETKIVWITMLALSDRYGYVGASIPGIAQASGVPVQKAAEAIERFLAPDEWSRSKEFDGRRIEVADRGWTILNYERFRDMRDEEARREYERDRKREQRAKQAEERDGHTADVTGRDTHGQSGTVPQSPGQMVENVDCPAMSAHAEASASVVESHDRAIGRLFLFVGILAVLVIVLSIRLPAQTVHVANYSGAEFDGWKRATVDIMPPAASGRVGDVRYVLGRRIGVDARVIDVHVHLDPGEIRSIDLRRVEPLEFELAPLPADPLLFFGRPTIAGVPLGVVDVQPDGAAWLAHLRASTGPMLCTDLWVTWYPDQPSWAMGEAVVTASNPSVPDLVATVPEDFRLCFGAAEVAVPGLPIDPIDTANGVPQGSLGARSGGARLLPAGTIIGDGQARSFPLVFIWRQHLTSEMEWSSAGAAASLSICANGIAKLWPDGDPQPVPKTKAWIIRNWSGSIARLHSWEAGPVGVAARSGDTGAQDDQVFVGGECVSGPSSLGAETVRYLAALGQSRRPCHHLEADGSLLDLSRHPRLVMWSGRAHWHTGVSPDQLGKPRGLTEIESHGWSGPDREHWLINNLAIAYRLTGSPALQWQLEAQYRLFMMQETIDPRLSTTDFSAERAIGWAGIVAVHLWRSLEDRAEADTLVRRWQDRVRLVYIPKLGSKPKDVWKPQTDPRLVASTGWTPLNWMPYQQAVGAYGLDYACRHLGPAEGRELALRGAKAAMEAWQEMPDGTWKPWSFWGFSATDTVPFVEHAGAGYGPNVWVWFTPCVWMVHAHDPQSIRWEAVWKQSLRDADPKWVPVEAVR